MLPSTAVQSMGWTRRNVGVTVLLAMDEHRKQAGQRLAQLRDAKGWSQEDLAREAKLSTKTVSRFENGRHDGRRSTTRQLAAALEVDEADILGPAPDPLGLGAPSQLDRVEAKLDALLEHFDVHADAVTRFVDAALGDEQPDEPREQPEEDRDDGDVEDEDQ